MWAKPQALLRRGSDVVVIDTRRSPFANRPPRVRWIVIRVQVFVPEIQVFELIIVFVEELRVPILFVTGERLPSWLVPRVIEELVELAPRASSASSSSVAVHRHSEPRFPGGGFPLAGNQQHVPCHREGREGDLPWLRCIFLRWTRRKAARRAEGAPTNAVWSAEAAPGDTVCFSKTPVLGSLALAPWRGTKLA